MPNLIRLASLLLLLTACAPDRAEPEAFRMEPETAIGLPGAVTDAAADRRGWIFAADAASKSVRLFAPDGRQVREFGDFGDISALTVDSRSRVVVADAGKGVIVLLRPWGQEIRAIPSPLGAARIHQITELPDGRYLLAAIHEGHLLHIVNRDLTAVTDRLVPTENPSADPGCALMLDDGRIAHVSAAYDGTIPLYSRHPEGWIPTDSLRTSVPAGTRLNGFVKRSDGSLLILHHAGALRAHDISADATVVRSLLADTLLWADPQGLRLFDVSGDSLLYLGDQRDAPMIRVVRTSTPLPAK